MKVGQTADYCALQYANYIIYKCIHVYMFFVVAPCQHLLTYKFYIPFTGVLMFGNFNEMPTIILFINCFI